MTSRDSIVYVLVAAAPVRDFICGMLSSAGLAPVTLGSAYEYLAQPEATRPTCLILSVELPDMSGLALQRRIATNGAALVFVSERVDAPLSVSAMKAGAVDFLTTPMDPRELIHAVRSAVEVDRRRRAEQARLEELRSRYGELTRREREALPLITAGLLNKQTASIMGISPITLQIHRGRIMRKMAARSFAELVRIADALGTPTGVAG
jgi:FixJ family two-component response regulator